MSAKLDPPTGTRLLHSVLGATIAVFIWIVSVTGAVALFDEEIHLWESSASRIAPAAEVVPIDGYTRAVVARALAQGELVQVNVSPPRLAKPYFGIAAQIRGKTPRAAGLLEERDPGTGALLDDSASALSVWLRDLHSDFALRSLNGRYVLGALGILLLATSIAGIAMHRRLLACLLQWPLGPAGWRNTHNALTAWLLPFTLMISATGAALSLMKPLIPMIASLALIGGGLSARDLVAKQIDPAGTPGEVMNLDALLQRAENTLGRAPLSMRIVNWGDANARAYFVWEDPRALTRASYLELDAVTGAVVAQRSSEVGGLAGRLDSAIAPLHFGTYGYGLIGSLLLRLCYFLLALGLALAALSGLRYWLAKTQARAPSRVLTLLSRASAGVCYGMIPANACAMLAAKAPLFQLEPGPAYLGAWLIAIAASFLLSGRAVLHGSLAWGGAALALAVAFDAAQTIASASHHAIAWGVNATLMLLAIALGFGALWRMRQTT